MSAFVIRLLTSDFVNLGRPCLISEC